jgi:type IV pilus assembly protein PilC
LYILIGANLPIKQALPLVAQSCMNQAYRLAWIAAYEKIKNGMALSQVLGADLFPEELTQLILIGEQSSALPTLLEKSYQAYLNELFNSLSRLAQLLEPLSILFLALMLGGIIIIMYLPIFQLGNLF